MQQGPVLQSLAEQSPNWKLWIGAYIVWMGGNLLTFPWGERNPEHDIIWVVCLWSIIPLSIAFAVVIYRFNCKKKCVMLEAMGEYEKAMTLAAKYAPPQLITLFRQRYASQLAQENKPQPTQANNSEQNASVINIHNVQTQQGPTEINVQDSVVTDWNQR